MKLYCGIDLHSTMSYIVIMNETRRVILKEQILNELWRFVKLLKPYKKDLVGVAIESTYNWYWLVDGLMESGYDVRLVNAAAVEPYSGLKYTDDRHDAWQLAELMRVGCLPTGFIYPKEQRGIRDLLRQRVRLVRQRTSTLVSLKNAMERERSERVKTNDLKRLGREYIEASGFDSNVKLKLLSSVNVAEALDKEISSIEKRMDGLAKEQPSYPLLQTIPGVGKVLAWTIVYETGPIERFRKAGHYASYCRCVGSQRLSNGKKKGEGNRKNGNAYLAWAFMEAANFAIRYSAHAKSYYERKCRRSHPVVARKALAHKLARASYYVMKEQVAFDPAKAFA